jgi:hypothetical protein
VTRKEWSLLAIVILLALAFFVSNAHLELASDDLQWLRGEIPRDTDRYRVIPRLTMAAIGAACGENAVPALATAFLFHAANGLLLYALARRLLRSQTAATIATAVLLINPVTLNTLTWISCLSYVQGVTAALVALVAFWRAMEARGRARLAWGAAALAAYSAALFCSHEVLFLPVAVAALGWFRREWRAGVACFILGMAIGGTVNATAYQFGEYGIEAGGLASPGFVAAYLSSALAAGPVLGVAYVLSFVTKPAPIVVAGLSGTARWAVAAGSVLAGVLLYRRGRDWRLAACLAVILAAAVAPWIIRLYLTPANVHYDLAYLAWGRVLYWPFVVVALGLGLAGARIARAARGRWALAAAGLLAYANGLRLYEPADFQALAMAQGQPVSLPPAWQPFASDQVAWFVALAAFVAAGGFVLRMVRQWVAPEAGTFPGK